jgi:hypothetical protein
MYAIFIARILSKQRAVVTQFSYAFCVAIFNWTRYSPVNYRPTGAIAQIVTGCLRNVGNFNWITGEGYATNKTYKSGY